MGHARSLVLVFAIAACTAGVTPAPESSPTPTATLTLASLSPSPTPTARPTGAPFVVAIPAGVVVDVDLIREGATKAAQRNGLELVYMSASQGTVIFIFDHDVPGPVRSEIIDLFTSSVAVSRSASPPPGATDAEAAARRLLASVVLISPPAGSSGGRAAGFFMTADGYVMTNAHVARDMPRVTVMLYDGRTIGGRTVGYVESGDPDVAVIKVDLADAPMVEFGSNADARQGDTVLKIGHPAGYGYWRVTGGRLLAPRTVPVQQLRADAPGAPGDSGGPLFDQRGRVIGLVSGGSSEAQYSARPAPFHVIWSWSEFDSLRIPPSTDAVPIDLARAKAAEIIARQGNVP